MFPVPHHGVNRGTKKRPSRPRVRIDPSLLRGLHLYLGLEDMSRLPQLGDEIYTDRREEARHPHYDDGSDDGSPHRRTDAEHDPGKQPPSQVVLSFQGVRDPRHLLGEVRSALLSRFLVFFHATRITRGAADVPLARTIGR